MNNISFKIIQLSTNQGLGNGLRVAVKNCSYDLIARMDADDIAVLNRFEKQLNAFITNPQVDIIGGQIMEFSEEPTRPTGVRQVPLTDNDIKTYLKKRCPFSHMTVMFKKTAVEKAGGYQDWYCNEDYYLWARMALKGAVFGNLPDVLVNVRTGNGMSARRGGWRYFKSEATLQAFLWENNLISLPRFAYNVLLRFGGEVVLPNWLRAQVFKLLRKSPTGLTAQGVAAIKNVNKPVNYPPFSVAMCVYAKDNPEHFRTALESVINQTVPPAEIVLVVDGVVPQALQTILADYAEKNQSQVPSVKKYKIGYTTGVYDMFHVGHLNILKRAKEQCEYLIVGISTDEVVQSYKHKTPVIPFEERCAIVKAVKYVDKVVSQTSMDKFAAWKNLHFNALFHGDDWKGSPMYEKVQEAFDKVGVDVVFLPHTDGISSTILSLRMKKNDPNK